MYDLCCKTIMALICRNSSGCCSCRHREPRAGQSGPACVQKASVAQTVEVITGEWRGDLLSGLERVKKSKNSISLKQRKHDKAFRERIIYSISQVSLFPVCPIVFSLIKYILLNCIFLLRLLLYCDKMRLCRQEFLIHWYFRGGIWQNCFISREKIILALLVVALCIGIQMWTK